MIAWSALVLPALLASVLVFVASSMIHMVLKWHQSEYRKLANEDEVRAVMRKGSPTPGKYVFPHCHDSKEMASPEMQKKMVEGPNVVMYVRPNGVAKLGPFLGSWFVYTIVVSLLAGYVARSVLTPEAEYLKVFQVIGASAWLAYAWGGPADSIWMGKPWGSTALYMFDGLIYAALTAGSFAWLLTR